MKIVLLENVKSLGKKGEVVNVSDGYARNFIFPKHLGEEANSANLAKLKGQKNYEDKVAKEKLDDAKVLAAKLGETTVTVAVKTGEGGKVFGSVSSQAIADALKAQSGLEIDKKKIVLGEPIKTVGEKELTIKLHKDVTATLKVVIEEQK